MKRILPLLLLFIVASCSSQMKSLNTEPDVDISKYSWILSRTPHMEEALYNKLLEIAKQNEFATENLLLVRQDCLQ